MFIEYYLEMPGGEHMFGLINSDKVTHVRVFDTQNRGRSLCVQLTGNDEYIALSGYYDDVMNEIYNAFMLALTGRGGAQIEAVGYVKEAGFQAYWTKYWETASQFKNT